MNTNLPTFTERGNTAIMNDNGASAIFKKLTPTTAVSEKATWFQAAFTPGNYPKWEIGIIELSEQEMKDFIQTKEGWYLLKNNLSLDIETNSHGEICTEIE